jgi:Uma2 family endonuclease
MQLVDIDSLDLKSVGDLYLKPLGRIPEENYFAFALANPDLRVELSAEGELVIMAPTGISSGDRNSELNYQLRAWAKRDGRGKTFDSSTHFHFRNGAFRSPDASWASLERCNALSEKEKDSFASLCPEFVAELKSPSDRMPELKSKMQEYMANGVQLGWLIDPGARTIYVYRQGASEPQAFVDIERLPADEPLAGFVLETKDIFS